MSNRKRGYYWVVLKGNTTIGYYIPGIPAPWSIIGYSASFKDSDFTQILQPIKTI